MNIAMVISNPFPPEEGIGYYSYNLSKNLIRLGHDVTLFTRGNSKKPRKSVFEEIKVIKIPFLPFYPFHVQLHQHYLEKFLNENKESFDIFHIHSPLSPPLKTDAPIISTIHTSLIEDMNHFQVLSLKSIAIKLTTHVSGRPLTQKLIDKSECVTTVSSAVAKELKKYYNANNPLVVGNGVDQRLFHPINPLNDNSYILFVGRLDYRKGIMELINASKLLKNEKIEIRIAGDGPLRSLFEEKIAKNGLNNVKLLGLVSHDHLVKLYQESTMFIFPSHYEGLPTVLLEAMACGIPVIVSNIPAHQDLIKDHVNGLFVKKGSAEDLAEKIKYLMDNPILRNKLGIAARKTIEKSYTWEKIVQDYIKLYKNLCY